MSRSLLAAGGGNRGHVLSLKCVPTSTLKGEIDDFITAGTTLTGLAGKFVFLSFGANYEVDSPAAGGRIDGRITAVKEDKINSTYEITCDIWSFADDNRNVYSANCIINVPYTGTLVRQNSCECGSTSTFFEVADGATDGFHNAVIAIDVPASDYCDVIIG